MKFCPASFFARWLGAAAFVMPAWPVPAQQVIQFSKPADQDSSSKAGIFTTTPNAHRLSANAYNAPSPLFGDRNPVAAFEYLPGSPGLNAVSAANSAQWQKNLDIKRNWMLMTPEEILGIPTPEKILGITDPDDDPKISAEERFLQRQDRLASGGVTNGFHQPDAAYWRGDSGSDPFHPADADTRFAQNLGGTIPDTAKNFSLLFDSKQGSLPDASQRSDSAWANPFGLPEPLPKPTPDQLEGMDRFRALMNQDTPEKTPEPAGFSYQPTAVPDPNLQVLPAFNPAGHSFTPLESGIGRPMGIMPLPGITGPQISAKKAAPTVQPPPWLLDTPQSFTPLERQF